MDSAVSRGRSDCHHRLQHGHARSIMSDQLFCRLQMRLLHHHLNATNPRNSVCKKENEGSILSIKQSMDKPPVNEIASNPANRTINYPLQSNRVYPHKSSNQSLDRLLRLTCWRNPRNGSTTDCDRPPRGHIAWDTWQRLILCRFQQGHQLGTSREDWLGWWKSEHRFQLLGW